MTKILKQYLIHISTEIFLFSSLSRERNSNLRIESHLLVGGSVNA